MLKFYFCRFGFNCYVFQSDGLFFFFFLNEAMPGFLAGTEMDVANSALCLSSCEQPDLCTTLSLLLPSLGRSLWHSQERHGHCCHVRHEAGAHHEVHHPCGHGGYHSHLRLGGCCANCQQHC